MVAYDRSNYELCRCVKLDCTGMRYFATRKIRMVETEIQLHIYIYMFLIIYEFILDGGIVGGGGLGGGVIVDGDGDGKNLLNSEMLL